MNPYGDDEYEDEEDYQNNPEYFCPLCLRHEDYCQCEPDYDDDYDALGEEIDRLQDLLP